MRTRQRDIGGPKSQDADRGLMQYTTLMLILVTFFLVLVSRANFDETKYSSAVSSIRESLGNSPGGRVAVGETEGLPDFSIGPDLKAMSQEAEMARIRALLAPAVINRDARIIHAGSKRIISLSAGLVFNLDTDEINAEMAETLSAIAAVIGPAAVGVDIEGHTDNRPPQTRGVGDNWDIAGRRALAVLDFLAGEGQLPPERLAAFSYAGAKPLYSNATPEGRARNNRVDLVLDFAKIKPGELDDLADRAESYNFQGFDFLLRNNFGDGQ